MADLFKTIAGKLLTREAELYPTEEWDDLIDVRIGKLSFDNVPADRSSYVNAVKAGLYLLNDSLDASHTLSQDIHNATGSFWHGVMHRMEGDYWNSKYWFRQVGSHPAFGPLLESVRQYAEREADLASIVHEGVRGKVERLASAATWDPHLFVDTVEQQVTVARDEHAESVLKHIQKLEMVVLLDYCLAQIGGGNISDCI